MGIDAQLVASLREAHEYYSKPVAGVHRMVVPALGGTSPIEPTQGVGFPRRERLRVTDRCDSTWAPSLEV